MPDYAGFPVHMKLLQWRGLPAGLINLAPCSGANGKAGTALSMIRRVGAHTVKEAFRPSPAIACPYMSEK